MTIADGDFAVGAQVDQRKQILGAGDADGKNPSQNVRSHKTAQATLKANAAVRGQRPAQILRLKMLRTLMGGLERHMRKRLDIEPGKQMVHHRVADQTLPRQSLRSRPAASFAIICRSVKRTTVVRSAPDNAAWILMHHVRRRTMPAD